MQISHWHSILKKTCNKCFRPCVCSTQCIGECVLGFNGCPHTLAVNYALLYNTSLAITQNAYNEYHTSHIPAPAARYHACRHTYMHAASTPHFAHTSHDMQRVVHTSHTHSSTWILLATHIPPWYIPMWTQTKHFQINIQLYEKFQQVCSSNYGEYNMIFNTLQKQVQC